MLILDSPQDIADWVCALRGCTSPTVDAAIGVQVDGDLVAGVYFDAATDNNVFAHIANIGPVLPESLLRAVAAFIYRDLHLTRMTFAVTEGNKKTIKLVEGMGAKLEASLEQAGDEKRDLLLYVLWRDAPFVQRMLARETSNGK